MYSTPPPGAQFSTERRSFAIVFEPVAGFEPATSSLSRKCSTPELHRQYINLERKTRLKLATLSLEG